KHNYLVRSAAELLEVVPDAFRVAASRRPGPVVIDVPKDVQNETIDVERLPDPGRPDPPPVPAADAIATAAALIDHAMRPIVLVGAGVIAAGASALLRRIADRACLPVASTLLGLGAMPADHPLAIGMVGMHAARYTNLLLEECDLLVALGIRFDDRATGKAASSVRARRTSTATSTRASSARSNGRTSRSRPTSATCCGGWSPSCGRPRARRGPRASSTCARRT